MAGYRRVKSVRREPKKSTKPLKIVMVAMTVLMIFMAVAFETGYMLFAFIFAALYLYFDANAGRDFEYTLEDDILTIDVIKAKRKRATAHVLDMGKLEVLAPHYHEAVNKYKKGNSEGNLRKFDYSSGNDAVLYYTMIVFDGNEKIKLLLDLDEDMLMDLKRHYPSKVFMANLPI